MKRTLKRLFIIFVYFIIFGAISASIYYMIRPDATCSDGMKNQDETGIDCGGSCESCKKEINAQEIKIEEKYFVYGNDNRFDVMAKLSNPNDKYGATRFKYEFKLVDQGGAVLSTEIGESFILPKETKYVIALNMHSSVNPYKLEFTIVDITWEEFLSYEEPKLNIYSKDYSEESDRNTVYGLLRNESYFDFNSLTVDIVLRGRDGKPVALGKTEMRTIKSQEERDFKFNWPYRFGNEVDSVEVRAEANVFDSDNFIKKYLPRERFQDYGVSK
jgi:hypothetical protein